MQNNLLKAVICDIDGTLAVCCDRDIYDASKALGDTCNEHVAEIVQRYATDHQIIIMTGRNAEHKDVTMSWLHKHDIPYDLIFTRADGDMRKDSIVKRELYDTHIKGKFNVKLVLDDRLQVCRVWHELGLPLLRVGDPDANF